MSNLSITSEPTALDFIKNNPFIEFQNNNFHQTKGHTTLRFEFKTAMFAVNVRYRFSLKFTFLQNTVTFLLSDSLLLLNRNKNDSTVLTIVHQEKEMREEFERKIKNNPLISQFYNVSFEKLSNTSGAFGVWDMRFDAKTAMNNDRVNASYVNFLVGIGVVQPALVSNRAGVAPNLPENWKLWAKFIVTKREDWQQYTQIETPEMLFDILPDETFSGSGLSLLNCKVGVPLEILKNYFLSADVPAIDEPLLGKNGVPTAYPVFKNSIKTVCQYTEISGKNMQKKVILQTKEYTIFNGELDSGFHKNKLFDWVTKDFPNHHWIPSTLTEIMVWGTSTGEKARIFRELPQWIYVSTLKTKSNTTIVLRAEYPLVIKPGDPVPMPSAFQLTLLPNMIYRIPVSMKNLELPNNIPSFFVTLKEQSATQAFFRRDFEVTPKPYHARVFLLQNKYGLLESFWIDNLLEEKTIDGEPVRLSQIYALDISKVETVYTARTGSKRISEMQILKAAIENTDNYIMQDKELFPITILPLTLQVADEEDDLQSAEFQFIRTHGAKALPAGYWGTLSTNKITGQIPPPNSTGNGIAIPIRIDFLFEQIHVVGGLTEIKLKDANGDLVPCTPQIDGNTLVISHDGLERGMQYEVIIPDGLFENIEATQWSFTTIETIEVVEFIPQKNSINNTLSAQISVKFNQDIEALNLSLITLSSSLGTLSIAPAITGNILQIEHAELTNNQQYTVSIPAGAIKDFTESIQWQFNTINEIAVSAFKPPFFASEVTVNEPVSVTFNQNISLAESHNIQIINNVGDEIEITSLEIQGNILIINHIDFQLHTTYTVNIPPNSVTGHNSLITWQFTTVASEYIPLEVIDISAAGDSVPVNENIVITFSKTITASDLSGIVLRNADDDEFETDAEVSGNKLIITHAVWDFQTQYFVSISADAIQGFNQEITFDFRTITFVEILSISPNNGDVDVPVNQEITIVFNQNITAVNLNLITVKKTNNTNLLITSSTTGNTLTINHIGFSSEMLYTVNIPIGSILGFNRNCVFQFTSEFTSVVEVPPPTAIEWQPTGENVPVDTNMIAVTFDKSININNLDGINIYPPINFDADIFGNKLQLNIHQRLEYGTDYVVFIREDVIENYNEDMEWNFTTEEEGVSPMVIDIQPIGDNVPIDTNMINVKFDRNIEANNLDAINILPPINFDAFIEENRLQIMLHQTLEYNVFYNIIIDAGVIKNYDQEIVWNFRTKG